MKEIETYLICAVHWTRASCSWSERDNLAYVTSAKGNGSNQCLDIGHSHDVCIVDMLKRKFVCCI